ncbi:MAG: divergent polysaccharide deacetylase family protein [Candidatus Aminicenantes bacterium]|nr:divergent polysaccharide deacetylase family protein [Candidatus Aminicenantes bacterium]
MRKRLPPKGRQPWPAFYLVTSVLAAMAFVSFLLLDYINLRKGEPSYIFVVRKQAPAAAPEKRPVVKAAKEPAPKPAEEPAPKPPEKPPEKPFDEIISASLTTAGVSEDAVLELQGPKGRPLFEVEIPVELYASVEPILEKALKAETVRVVGKKRTAGEERTEVLWALRRAPNEDAGISFILPVEPPAVIVEKEAPAKQAFRGQVALIMDDMGNSLETLDELIALGRHVTVSVLPYSTYAAETARAAHKNGLEVLLHLPLESLNNHEAMANTEGMILAGMTETDIVRSFEASFSRVPFAAGMNNHMGSRFTAERALMRAILKPLKMKGLFFVDSRTTSKTVALDEARRMGIPSTERDVFLDADEDRGRIRGRLIELFQKARKKGHAVGICHPFPETLAVLKSTFPLIDSYGLEAVPVSRLVR